MYVLVVSHNNKELICEKICCLIKLILLIRVVKSQPAHCVYKFYVNPLKAFD